MDTDRACIDTDSACMEEDNACMYACVRAWAQIACVYMRVLLFVGSRILDKMKVRLGLVRVRVRARARAKGQPLVHQKTK